MKGQLQYLGYINIIVWYNRQMGKKIKIAPELDNVKDSVSS